MKRRTYLVSLLTMFSLSGVAGLGVAALLGVRVGALSYQSETDLQFTFNPEVSISISGGDLSIDNLSPGSYLDSNIITITTSSNNASGYTLYSTVGSSSNDSTELRKDGTDTTNKFDSITGNIASLNSFSDSSNTWGYSYSTDSGSTWISGSQGSTASGYNGLPLYNSSNAAAGVVLADTLNANESTIQFKIGVRATDVQAAGAYTNVVNFVSVPKVVTRNYTLVYNANSGIGAPSSTSGTVTSTNPVVTLDVTAPTRDGYTFKGWCDVATSNGTCSGKTTQPGHIYAVDTGGASAITVTMYAIWESA